MFEEKFSFSITDCFLCSCMRNLWSAPAHFVPVSLIYRALSPADFSLEPSGSPCYLVPIQKNLNNLLLANNLCLSPHLRMKNEETPQILGAVFSFFLFLFLSFWMYQFETIFIVEDSILPEYTSTGEES